MSCAFSTIVVSSHKRSEVHTQRQASTCVARRQMGQMLYGTRWERRVQLQAPALLAAN